MGKHCGTYAWAPALATPVASDESRPGRHRANRGTGAAAGETSRVATEGHGGMGLIARLGAWLGQKVPAKTGSGRKAAIFASILRFRLSTYIWELQQQRRYWEEWQSKYPGATDEFAQILHDIPRVRNHD